MPEEFKMLSEDCRWIHLSPENAFKSVWYQGHIGQAIIWPYNLPRPLFQIRAHLSTFYPTPVLGPKIVALFFFFAAAIEV